MHRLVSDFIIERFAAGEMSGGFRAVALFVDISGFSTLTDELMAHGQYGAEILATIMRTAFEPLLHSVYEQGGFVVTLAGDAFTALFPLDGPQAQGHQRALAAAGAIQERMAAVAEQATPSSTFSLAVKVGVAVGEVDWGIVLAQNGARAAYYFRGPAIDGCAAAEHCAHPGDIILAPDFYAAVNGLVTVESAANTSGPGDHYRLTELTAPLPPPVSVDLPPLDLDVTAHFYPPALVMQSYGGEFRHVINLFISLPTVRTEAQLAIFMRSLFALQDRYGGLLNRLDFGDKGAHLLLFWGAPVAHENDVERALDLVLDLQTQTSIPINAGVTYRISHAGFIGSDLREEYTCFGRGINLAARFMTHAARGEIWMDEAVAQRAARRYDLEFEGALTFKGFSEPQQVYVLYERQEEVEALFLGEFVGREAELAQLAGFCAPLRDGRYAGVMVIKGEAGIGKSRLVHAFLTDAAYGVSETCQVFLAQADEILQGAFDPFRYWLRRHFGQSQSQSEARNKRAFNRALDRLIDITEDKALVTELDRTRSFLGALVDLRWPDSLYEQSDPQGRYENSFIGLLSLLKAESLQRPVIVHLEDAHWLDEASRAFLGSLVQALTADDCISYPFALIVTTRPTGRETLPQDLDYREIDLSPLTEDGLAHLVQDQLGGSASPELLGLLAERCEGNPFFAEQILRFLKERELLALSADGWRVVEGTEAALLPTDVRAVLVARLDQLTQDVKEVVQTASVLGREFEVRVLAHMLRDDRALPEKIAYAERAAIWGLLSEMRYIFRHALLRDAAYHMQVRAQRQALHALAMTSLEELHAQGLPPRYAELAYHAEGAGLPDKTRAYLQQAGDAAREVYENRLATAYYRQALDITRQVETTGAQLLYLYTHLGRALELNSQFDQALTTYQEMAQMARKQDDPALELAALMAQVPLLVVPTPLFDPQHGLTLGQQALMLARELDDQVAEAKLLWNLSTACIWNDLGSQAIEYGEGSLALARQLNLREQMALTLTDLGTFCYAFSGRLDQAKDALREAGAIWRELDNLPMLANNQASLGWICCFTGEYDKAETYSQEAIRLSEISNNIWGQSYSRYRLGYVYWDRGEPDKAIKTMEACIRYSDLAGINATDVVRADLAAVYGGLGAVERGLDVARSALAKADSRVLFVRPWILGVLAQLCLARDDLAEAQIAIDKATRSPGQETFVVNFASVRLAEGELFLRKGDYGQAVKVLEALFTDLDQFSMRSEMPSVLYLQGQALLDLGRTAAARHCFLEAHAEAQAIGSRRMLWRILTALASIEDDPAEGERLRRQAQETVEYIIRHISDPELRTSFLNLPEVQSVVEKT